MADGGASPTLQETRDSVTSIPTPTRDLEPDLAVTGLLATEERHHVGIATTLPFAKDQPDTGLGIEAEWTAQAIDQRPRHQAESHPAVDLTQRMEAFAGVGEAMAPAIDAEGPRVARSPKRRRDASEHAFEGCALGSGKPGAIEPAVAGTQLDAGESAAAVDQQSVQRDRQRAVRGDGGGATEVGGALHPGF